MAKTIIFLSVNTLSYALTNILLYLLTTKQRETELIQYAKLRYQIGLQQGLSIGWQNGFCQGIEEGFIFGQQFQSPISFFDRYKPSNN
jgi:hypothetical protein